MFKANRQFQAGLDEAQSRRRRQRNALSLRRQDRAAKLQKKRQRILCQSDTNTLKSTSSSTDKSPTNQSEWTAEDIPKLARGVFEEHPATQLQCVRGFRKLLSIPKNAPIQKVVDSKVVPRIISFCNQSKNQSKNQELQYEALWALANICSGPPPCCAEVIRNGSVKMFIDLLKSPLYEIQSSAMWCCGNIAGESKELRNQCFRLEILQVIHEIVKMPLNMKKMSNFNDDKLKRHPKFPYIALISITSWTISNLFRSGLPCLPHKPTVSSQHSPTRPQVMIKLVDILKCLLDHFTQFQSLRVPSGQSKQSEQSENERCSVPRFTDEGIKDIEDILPNIAWTCFYLTVHVHDEEEQDALAQLLGRKGMIQRFVAMMDDENEKIRKPIAKMMGNILTGSDDITAKCLSTGLLTKYSTILEMGREQCVSGVERKEICWCISNICACSKKEKLAVLEAGLFSKMISILRTAPFVMAKEALWAVSNAVDDGDKRLLAPMVKMGMLEALCHFIKKYKNIMRGNQIILVVFECLECVLNAGEQHLCDGEENKYAVQIEEHGGLDWLEEVQADEDIEDEVYHKCYDIISTYYEAEECLFIRTSNGKEERDINEEMPDDQDSNHQEGGIFSFGINNKGIGDDRGPYIF